MIKIYKDAQANAIFFEDSNGVQFLNSVQATVDNSLVTVVNLARSLSLVSDVAHSEFVDQNGNSYGADPITVCNELNAIFSSSGTPLTNTPEITSALSINSVEGSVINYELTANYGVGYEWDLSNVPGVTLVEGNTRKIIGGSSLAAGSYNIPVKAINYNGEDSETIALTVSNPPFSNTKSINFSNQDWLGANAAQVEHALGRSANGSGSSDAWSVSLWYKGSTDNQGQTIFYFGNNDTTNQAYIELRQTNHNGSKRLRFRYGSSNNYIQLTTPSGSITPNTWQHILITYDGGTTGASSGSVSNYYSRFGIFIDGTAQTTSNTHSNYGWSGSVVGQNWRVGRFASGSHMRQAKVDELAIFDSDQSANISDIYNAGAVFDLSTLTEEPKHWWRMGDGDTYPNLQDSGTEANCTFVMYSMTSADIVNDVPA
ncbi:putative carbohydrate-binding module [uncultured Mediterranean phage uvMED]|nr:putative carbohydrate-binding module [uncultured Mediterranean phage uvMED]BAR22565.1 putative carbohydrate-binding module [uncultured Mediterranean phage uvMED]